MSPIGSILLVDDDPDDRELFQLALETVDKSILLMTATGGRDALLLLQESVISPDIIFMDINMPGGLNGFETITELKKNKDLSDILTAIYSTSTSPADKALAKQIGVDWYFNKPAQFAALCQLLNDFIVQGNQQPGN